MGDVCNMIIPAELLEFEAPKWYCRRNPEKRCLGEICWQHEEVCEPVEDLLGVCQTQERLEKREKKREERMEKREKKWLERMPKMKNFLRNQPCSGSGGKMRTMEEPIRNRNHNLKLPQDWTIDEEGKRYDVPRLVSGPSTSNYLIESNGHQVKVDHLSGSRIEQLEEREQKLEERMPRMKNFGKMRKMEEDEECISIHELRVRRRNHNHNHNFKLPPEWTIEEGKRYDVPHLLSGPSNRDYLIKSNGHQVKINHLSGSHVLLYFWLLANHTHDAFLEENLVETYFTFGPKGMFEVVLVAIGENKAYFDDAFSRMPWLAIPHEDQETRDCFVTKFGITQSSLSLCGGGSRAVLFAPDGTILQKDAESAFRAYGSQGFPFTKEKIDYIRNRERALWDELVLKIHQPSLTAIFGEHLISPEGEKVPTSKFEGKIVGLYFFQSPSSVEKKLYETWKLLKYGERRKDFEIVFVNKCQISLSGAKAEFEQMTGHSFPWYVPTVDGRQLSRVFRNGVGRGELGLGNAGNFVVLKPDSYQSLSYFAYEILNEFGIDSYPFTMERAVTLTKCEQRKELVLSELLSTSAPLHRGGYARDKEENITVTVPELEGKCVLLLFAMHSCYVAGSFLTALKQMYIGKRGGAEEVDFEIIYMSLDCDEFPESFLESVQGMPWLIHPFVPQFAFELAKRVFRGRPLQLPAIAAFGLDGHLDTKECNLAFKEKFDFKYPFIEVDMSEEVHRELLYRHKWDFEHVFAS